MEQGQNKGSSYQTVVRRAAATSGGKGPSQNQLGRRLGTGSLGSGWAGLEV